MTMLKMMSVILVTMALSALFTRCGSNLEAGWNDLVLQKRTEKDRFFKSSPTSPMAAAQRLMVFPGSTTTVTDHNGHIRLFDSQNKDSQNKNHQDNDGTVLFQLGGKDNRWQWHGPASGGQEVTCISAGQRVTPGSFFSTAAEFRAGSFTLRAYPSTDVLVLVVFSRERKELKAFSNLLYFPPDPDFSVPATLKKFPTMTKLTMLTSQNQEKTFFRYAAVNFRVKDRDLTLTAFKSSLTGPHSDILFIPFSDSTNGGETYGSGRFLEVREPADTDRLTLDFNHCFNPLCNYSPAYNCPIPPAENNLDIAIRAGEKTYPH